MGGEFGLGTSALINITISLISIAFCWWVISNMRLDRIISKVESPHIKLFTIILSVVLGHGLATFLIDYLSWSRMIKYLF
ncbi:DUF1146 family protein [Mechercharimyces sp. CAU 1602]|nr:DUF1146 family protein [Mechercharimyces sp. CAU 1602]